MKAELGQGAGAQQAIEAGQQQGQAAQSSQQQHRSSSASPGRDVMIVRIMGEGQVRSGRPTSTD